MTEEQLIRLAAAGDQAAGRRLYEDHWRAVYAVAFRFVGTGPDAEDVMQDAFIKAFKALGRFDYRREGGFSAWLRRIAAHEAVSFLRKRRLRRPDDGADLEAFPAEEGQGGSSPQDSAERTFLLAEVRRGLADLSPAQREAFDQRYLQHRDIRDIAAAMKCGPNSVKKHLERGMAKLRRRLEILGRTP